MNNFFRYLFPLFLAAILLSGCARYSPNLSAFTGTNIKDLEAARAEGKEEVFPLPYDTAFDRVTQILEGADLTIYQTNRKKGHIVAMGFPKQIDTTRVGIFFEPQMNGTTKITLSSLSDTALAKAEAIVFEGLR